MYISAARGFLMVTFAAQQLKNVSPSMPSNHETGFSLPFCSHTIGWKSEHLHPPRRHTHGERCASIIHGICGYAEWTGHSKLGTFCSDASQSPRGANYDVSPSEQSQNNRNSLIFPRAQTGSSEKNVHSLVSHSVSPTDTRWNHTCTAFITCWWLFIPQRPWRQGSEGEVEAVRGTVKVI